jgi:hypothetical protein
MLGDVAAGDRAEQLVVLADLTVELEGHQVDLLGERLGAGALLRHLLGDDALVVLELVDVGGGGRHRHARGTR